MQWAVGVSSPQGSVCVEKESQDRGVTVVPPGTSKANPLSGHASVSITPCITHLIGFYMITKVAGHKKHCLL